MGTHLEFWILGPLEVRHDGMLLPVGGPRQRALLSLLLCNANRVVSRDRLVDELLGDHPPESAERLLRVQVSRLRSALAVAGDEPRLIARPPGYLLRVEDDELDLDEFERRLNDGRQALEHSDSERAGAILREAESLWRGRPLADLEFERSRGWRSSGSNSCGCSRSRSGWRRTSHLGGIPPPAPSSRCWSRSTRSANGFAGN